MNMIQTILGRHVHVHSAGPVSVTKSNARAAFVKI